MSAIAVSVLQDSLLGGIKELDTNKKSCNRILLLSNMPFLKLRYPVMMSLSSLFLIKRLERLNVAIRGHKVGQLRGGL